MKLGQALTERREVHVALLRQEGVDLPLALELGGKFFGGDLRESGVATCRLRALARDLRHLGNDIEIIEFLH